jgi:L-alanine-DL-glutamate epimerase-like enolase superfamily enzyme
MRPQTAELREKGEPDLHIPLLCDANTGWKMHDALRVVNAVRHLDVYIEQPCLSYEECVSVRRMCPLPFVIDESMDDIGKRASLACLLAQVCALDRMCAWRRRCSQIVTER